MSYTTKDSKKRVKYKSGMMREPTNDRPRYDLTIALTHKHDMITRFAELLARGATKYAARNWEKANSQEELNRAIESAWRHFVQWAKGDTDEDHAAAVYFNINMAEYLKEKLSHKKLGRK